MTKKEFIEAIKKNPSLFEKRHEIPQTNNHGEPVFLFDECSEPFTCEEFEELEHIYNSEVKKYILEGLKQAYESAVERGCDTIGMSAVEYFAHVKPDIDEHDYGTWHQFKDTFPPISNWDGITVEVLYEDGDPGFEGFILNKEEGTVRMHDYDSNLELLEWQLDNWMERYWRFIPEPPGNFGYNVG